MRFQLIIIFILFLSTIKIFSEEVTPDTTTINFMRNEFYKAIEDEDKTYFLEEFVINKYSADYSSYSPLILAYYGGIQTLKAKHTFNPFSKLSHLISGLNRLEEAINKSPDNLEIRFMRFSILDHVPGILGYSEDRESDKNKIINLLLQRNYSSLNYNIQKGIAEYMMASDRLNNMQKTEIRDLLSSFANK